MELELGGVLHGDDPLVARDVRRHHVERGGLAGTGTTGDEDVETTTDTCPGEVGHPLGDGPEVDQVRLLIRVDGELTNRQEGPADRQWVDDRVDTRPVRETGVHHRGRLVDATPDLTDDLVDDPAEVDLVHELHVGEDDLAPLLVVDVVGAVGHDLGDVRVVEERVDRAVAEDVGGDLVEEGAAIGGGQGEALLLVDCPLQHLQDTKTQLGVGHLPVVEGGAQLLDHLEVEPATELAQCVRAVGGDVLSLGLPGGRNPLR